MRMIVVGVLLWWNWASASLWAQDSTSMNHFWTLRECIDYARAQNIQVRSAQLSSQQAAEDYRQAQAARLPDLNFSSSQNFQHQKHQGDVGYYTSNASYAGSYALNAGITLFGGSKLRNAVKQQAFYTKSSQYAVAVAANEIEISVTQGYLQILYAHESLKTYRQTLETSTAQFARAKSLYEAGSIAMSDLAQLEAQCSNDKYQVVVGENALSMANLQLKQLLELELGASFAVASPVLQDDQILKIVPSLEQVYRRSLEVMPEVKVSQLGVDAAGVGRKLAVAGGLPQLAMSASVGTGNYSQSGLAFGDQLNNRLNESAGLNLSIPIFTNRQVRTAVNKAKIQESSARLEYLNTCKNLLKTIESLHQDAVSAQSRYEAAAVKVRATEQSYRLVREQFDAGLRNTVDLLTEKNNYLAAQQEQIQAKYQAILSLKLLNFYQDEPIIL